MCYQTVISVDKTESRASVVVIAHGIGQNYKATFTLILTNNTKKHVTTTQSCTSKCPKVEAK